LNDPEALRLTKKAHPKSGKALRKTEKTPYAFPAGKTGLCFFFICLRIIGF
jgi:hypothetical protein